MSEIYTANQGSFTFHVRVTKKCNADCSYCSSFERSFSELMSLEDLEKSMSFISNLIEKYSLGGIRKVVTVQYVGGELLTLPVDYFREFTNIVEDKLSKSFKEVKEETGIEDLNFKWGKIFYETESYGCLNKTAYYFLAETKTLSVSIENNPLTGIKEHEEYKWVKIKEAKKMTVNRINRVLNWVEKRIYL